MFSFFSKLYRLLRNRHISRPELLNYQDIQLRKLLHHAYRNCPYYAERFRAAGFSEKDMDCLPITALPTMSKADLIENYDRIITLPSITQETLRRHDAAPKKGILPRGCKVVHSSGSTALPTFFLYGKEDWQWVVAGAARMVLTSLPIRQMLKILTGPRRILYTAVSNGSFGGVTLVESVARFFHAKLQKLDVSEPVTAWKQALQNNPNVLVGYPSSLELLMEMALEEKLPFKAELSISAGEPLSPALHTYLQKSMGCRVVNLYACSESLILGTEQDDGFILFDDLNLIEVIDGVMYLTSLYNFAQPIIRYRLSDSVELLPPDDSSPFSRCRIRGCREEEILRFRDDSGNQDFLHPLLFEDFCIPGLLDYQLRQTSPSHFNLVYVTAKEADAAAIGQILHKETEKILRQHTLQFVTFRIAHTDAILPDPRTGKKKLAITLPKEVTAI